MENKPPIKPRMALKQNRDLELSLFTYIVRPQNVNVNFIQNIELIVGYTEEESVAIVKKNTMSISIISEKNIQRSQ